MKSRIDRFKPKGNISFHHKVMLDYVSRLSVCVESYKNGVIDAGTCLRICKIILNEFTEIGEQEKAMINTTVEKALE